MKINMTFEEAFEILCELMQENRDVLMRLKEGEGYEDD
jgi:hypothetical protein